MVRALPPQSLIGPQTVAAQRGPLGIEGLDWRDFISREGVSGVVARCKPVQPENNGQKDPKLRVAESLSDLSSFKEAPTLNNPSL